MKNDKHHADRKANHRFQSTNQLLNLLILSFNKIFSQLFLLNLNIYTIFKIWKLIPQDQIELLQIKILRDYIYFKYSYSKSKILNIFSVLPYYEFIQHYQHVNNFMYSPFLF